MDSPHSTGNPKSIVGSSPFGAPSIPVPSSGKPAPFAYNGARGAGEGLIPKDWFMRNSFERDWEKSVEVVAARKLLSVLGDMRGWVERSYLMGW